MPKPPCGFLTPEMVIDDVRAHLPRAQRLSIKLFKRWFPHVTIVGKQRIGIVWYIRKAAWEKMAAAGDWTWVGVASMTYADYLNKNRASLAANGPRVAARSHRKSTTPRRFTIVCGATRAARKKKGYVKALLPRGLRGRVRGLRIAPAKNLGMVIYGAIAWKGRVAFYYDLEAG